MRRLATIQRITAIHPIPGADKIVRADVLGWEVVVGVSEFKPGDLAVYFEIDSWLDATIPAFDTDVFRPRFINWTDPEGKQRFGMRLKTIKLRKQISQGLLMPLSAFPELANSSDELDEGADVTELLKVEKWEAYEETKGNGPRQMGSSKTFPSFIQKTDQSRVQNVIRELGKHQDEEFEVTIKLDGSSMTVYRLMDTSPYYAGFVDEIEQRMIRKMPWHKKLWWKLTRKLGMNNPPEAFYGVCSRNIELDSEGDSHFAQYVRDNDLFQKIDFGVEHTENYAFQGELIAPSIQANHEQVKGYEWHVFDIFDIDKQSYLLPGEARMVAKVCGFKYVPVLQQNIKLAEFRHEADASLTPEERAKAMVDNILTYAEGPGMNPGVKREGVVFKSTSSPFSFKAISNSYLLKKG
jgi:RNA ligase (TIGR02306 family)